MGAGGEGEGVWGVGEMWVTYAVSWLGRVEGGGPMLNC